MPQYINTTTCHLISPVDWCEGTTMTVLNMDSQGSVKVKKLERTEENGVDLTKYG